jgi:hypothetical protein
MKQPTHIPNVQTQAGMALIVTLVVLVLLTLLTLSSLKTAAVEEMVSGNQKLAAGALFAAEQGVSEGIEDLFDGTINKAGNWTGTGTATNTGYSTSYSIQPLLLADGSSVEDVEGRTYVKINSTGQSINGGARRRVEVGLALEMDSGYNVAGLIGCAGVTGYSNVVTESYSSSGEPTDGNRGDVATTDEDATMFLVGGSDFDINGSVYSTGALFIDSDTSVRRDAFANLNIKMLSGDVYGSANTNNNFINEGGTVHSGIYQGLTPIPLVPYEPPCDPLDIDSIFNNANSIKSSNHNAEIGKGSPANYDGTPSTLGVSGSAKDYYFNDFYLEDETVTIEGDVRIYVDQDFTMKSNPNLILAYGATLNIYMGSTDGNFWVDSNSKVNHDPADLWGNECNPGGCPVKVRVWSLAEDTPKEEFSASTNLSDKKPDLYDDSQDIAGVKIDSNSIFYGMIYAPRAHVVLYSNAQIYGSVRGRFVTTDSNLEFHYDEDLDTIYKGLPAEFKIVYWSEQYPENW